MKTQYFFKQLFRNINFILLVTILTTISSRVMAYTPPIGIPDPGIWGTTHPIEGTAPNTTTKCPDWPSAQTAGCYYIDNTHPQATDTSNTLGYPDKPRRTLPTSSFSAGAYVEIHGGPYATDLNLIFAGTAENPCWFRGTSGSIPLFTNRTRFGNSTYLFVEYLEFNGGNNNCISIYGATANNVVIRNCKFKNRTWTSNTSGVGITPDQNGNVHDIIVYNNEFSELGNWLATEDQDFHGINPNTSGRTAPTELHHVWMLNNSFYHLSGNGVQVNAGSAAMIDYLHHMYVGKNTGHANRQSVLWSKQASHVIMSQNICYDSRKHGSQPGDGIGYQYGPDNLWIIFNEIYDSNHGVRQSDTSVADLSHHSYIIGNKIYNIHPGDIATYNPSDYYRQGQAISLWTGNMNRHIIDNTIFDVHGGICINHNAPVDISGNIISNIYSADYQISNNLAGAVTTVNNGLFYDSNNNIKFRWAGASYTSLPTFQSGSGQCVNCMATDPQFTNASESDFSIPLTSPTVGMGSRHAVYDTFETLYGVNIAYDFNGNPRPSSGGWSIGAFEPPRLPQPQFKAIKVK